MPFCCRCGCQIGESSQYCSKCGAPQAGVRVGADFAAGMSPRTASILCYIPWVGWIAAIVVLASSTFRNNRTVRFHAFQGLYLFVAGLLIKWAFTPLTFFDGPPHFHLQGLLEMAILALWIFMIVKTSQGQVISLPVIGELAEKSLSE